MSAQGIVVTLLYPVGKKFDMNYYLTSHMPRAVKHMTPHGLTKWQVVQTAPDSDYSAICLLFFKDKKGADEAFATAQDVLSDIPNYTDVHPISIGGALVGGN